LKPEDKLDKLTDKLVIDARKGADNATKVIISNISEYLEKFELSDGSFVANSSKNAKLLTGLKSELARAINSSKYPSSVSAIIRSLPEIESLSAEVIASYNNGFQVDFDKLGVDRLRLAQTEAIVQNMTGSGLDFEILQPVRDSINRNVFGGATVTETKNYLRTFLEKSDKDKFNRMARYANVWAQDGVLQYDGMIYDQFRNEYKPNFIRYIGSLINDSRPQCVRWINKYPNGIPIEKLKSEITWAFNSGSGMNPATSSTTFCTYRGGYNCRHKAIPVFISPENENENE
jgi:hypothetical protein